MSERTMEEFVEAYAAAWASREPGIMATMWHADGVLDHPALGRRVNADVVPRNNDNTKSLITDFEWQLKSWASSGDQLFLEWRNKGQLGAETMEWAGVDVMTVRAGRIIDEIVYFDTYPLRCALDPSLPTEPLVDVDLL